MVQDGLGSVRGVVDNSVGVLWSGSPAPYGDYFGETGTRQTNYGFTGEYTDPTTQLVHLRARDYNPALGVFNSRDPFEGMWEEPMSINGYSYVHGNPVNRVDPSGLQSSGVNFWKGGSGFGGGISISSQQAVDAATALLIALGLISNLSAPQRQVEVQAPSQDWVLAPWYVAPEPPPPGPDWAKIIRWAIPLGAEVLRRLVERLCWGCVDVQPQSPASPQTFPTAEPNPTPRPTRTGTPTPEPRPIVLSLGPGGNTEGEVRPLLNYYRNRAKIVVIELDDLGLLVLNSAFSIEIAQGDLDVIDGSFSEEDILSRNGYSCANAAFSLWPRTFLSGAVAVAFNNLVCSQGSIYVVSDLEEEFRDVTNRIKGTYNFLYDSGDLDPLIPPRCVTNPNDAGCTQYGTFSSGVIGLTSSQNKDLQYVLKATKR